MTYLIELPGVYLDIVTGTAFSGLLVANEVPERDSTEAPRAKSIVLQVLCTNGANVDNPATLIYVDGILAYDGAVGGQNGWGVVATPAGTDYEYALTKAEEWASEAVATVRVKSRDDAGPIDVVDYTYTFTIEDYIAPTVVSATATGPSTVRVTFSEAMKAALPTGADDALNPALYALEYIQAEAGIAAVSASVVSVTQVSPEVYDLTTSRPLTFWKTYEVTALGVADDSVASNTVIAPNHSAQFASWSPPDWPERRAFDIYQMFAAKDRRDDATLDLKKLCSLFQDIVDQSLWQTDWFWHIWDTSLAPYEHLKALLADHGNPFVLDISEAQQRKLLDLLAAIYQQKGTKQGIINLARFFAGLTITDITVAMEDTWILGDDEYGILGETTILAPDNSAARYSFYIVVDRALTTAERVVLDEIVRKMKCAHEHAYVLEPADPEFVDHWELGLSYLGDNTYLH